MWQKHLYYDLQGYHTYFVFRPDTAPLNTPLPLVVMLHGCNQKAMDFATGTAMHLLAEQYGFVLLYPQQSGFSNYKRCWNWFLPANQHRERGEPARIVGMIKQVQQHLTPWSIDPTRIYVAGLSAGACLATILGATYPDLFAAIGVHAGLAYKAATDVRSAYRAMARGGPDPVSQGTAAYAAMGVFARVVPCIVFQGTNDATVAPTNGDQVTRQWLHTNQLAANQTHAADFTHPTQVVTGKIAAGHAYAVATWNTSNSGPCQAYWKIDGLSHAWSGGNPAGSHTDPRGPDASLVMYTFFMAHPMKEADRYRSIEHHRQNPEI